MRVSIALIVALAAGCEAIAATALFPGPGEQLAYGKAPFPSDLFRDPSGHVVVDAGLDVLAPKEADKLAAQLRSLDGFGTRPVIELPFDAALDASSVDADSVFVVDVASGARVPFDWRVNGNEIVGAIERGTVLEEATLYAAVVTDKVRAPHGRVAARAGLARLRTLDENDVPANMKSTRAALDALHRDDVVTVAAFTTEHARAGLFAARAKLDALPAPTISFDDASVIFAGDERLRALLGVSERGRAGEEELGWSHTRGLAHDHVAAVGTGTLHGVTFRATEDRGGRWRFDDDGAPIVDRALDIPVTFAIPSGAMPRAGWPVAFFGHGLGASRVQMLAFIETFARAGYATVAIDADGHGSRYANVDEHNNAAARMGPTFAGTLSMRDGFGDVDGNETAYALFHDFVNIAAMRDQMRESVIDLSQVVIAMRNADLSPLKGGARVDSSKVVYCGESFGGVLGALFAAEEPDVHLFYLDVPGGGVLEYIAPNSPILSIFYKLFLPSTYGLAPGSKLDRFAPFVGMGSAVVDGADPLAFARHMRRDRSVVIGEVIEDEVMPNSSTNALARAMNLPILAPAYDDSSGLRVVDGPLHGDVSAVVHFAPANHGDNWSNEAGKREYLPFSEDAIDFVQLPSPVAIENPVVDVHRQLRTLLSSYAAGSATLVSTEVPAHDFDGDGVPDDVDETPYGP